MLQNYGSFVTRVCLRDHCFFLNTFANLKFLKHLFIGISAVKPPKVVVPLQNTTAPENGPAKLSTKITGFPEPTIVWTLNNEEIQPTDNVSLAFDKKTSTYTLTLTGDLRGKGGDVKVTAKNIGGEADTSCTLTIKGRAPTFIEKPIKCTVLEGDTCVFRTRIDGDPEPKVEWTKGKWRKLENTAKTRVYYDEAFNQYALEIDDMKDKESGTYTCTISNEYGSDACSVTVTVTTNEEEVESWLSMLKTTIVQGKEVAEDEIDWRSGLKVR